MNKSLTDINSLLEKIQHTEEARKNQLNELVVIRENEAFFSRFSPESLLLNSETRTVLINLPKDELNILLEAVFSSQEFMALILKENNSNEHLLTLRNKKMDKAEKRRIKKAQKMNLVQKDIYSYTEENGDLSQNFYDDSEVKAEEYIQVDYIDPEDE